MKHYIRFSWDDETLAFVCDHSNAQYLRNLAQEGTIFILEDRTVYPRFLKRLQESLQYLFHPSMDVIINPIHQ